MLFVTKIFAAKTNTTESDWERIFSGEKTLLTADDLVRVNSIPKTDDEDLQEEKMLKILAMSRMSNEDATHVIQILNDFSERSPTDRKVQGMVSS